MKRSLAIILAVIAWFTLSRQYHLSAENSTTSGAETLIRFLSFYTFLTNALVALYFSILAFKKHSLFTRPGVLSALTVYISVAAVVYHLVLRYAWDHSGYKLIIDELLHSVIPLFVIIFWYVYERKSHVGAEQALWWLIYPIVYLSFILVRGNISGFYPHPFSNIPVLGLWRVAINCFFVLIMFPIISLILVLIGNFIEENKRLRRN
jgi:hypothetical protein